MTEHSGEGRGEVEHNYRARMLEAFERYEISDPYAEVDYRLKSLEYELSTARVLFSRERITSPELAAKLSEVSTCARRLANYVDPALADTTGGDDG